MVIGGSGGVGSPTGAPCLCFYIPEADALRLLTRARLSMVCISSPPRAKVSQTEVGLRLLFLAYSSPIPICSLHARLTYSTCGLRVWSRERKSSSGSSGADAGSRTVTGASLGPEHLRLCRALRLPREGGVRLVPLLLIVHEAAASHMPASLNDPLARDIPACSCAAGVVLHNDPEAHACWPPPPPPPPPPPSPPPSPPTPTAPPRPPPPLPPGAFNEIVHAKEVTLVLKAARGHCRGVRGKSRRRQGALAPAAAMLLAGVCAHRRRQARPAVSCDPHRAVVAIDTAGGASQVESAAVALQTQPLDAMSSVLGITIEEAPAAPSVIDVQVQVTRLAPSPRPPSPLPPPGNQGCQRLGGSPTARRRPRPRHRPGARRLPPRGGAGSGRTCLAPQALHAAAAVERIHRGAAAGRGDTDAA